MAAMGRAIQSRRWCALVGVLCLSLVNGPKVWAQQDFYWIGPPGVQDWGTASNWDLNSVPGPGDSAFLEPSDGNNRTAQFRNIHPPGTTLNVIRVNATGGSEMAIRLALPLPGGDLRAQDLYLGDTGQGRLLQDNGAVTVNNYFILGNEQSGNGAMVMGAGSLSAGNMVIGGFGSGAMDQSGDAAVQVANDLGVGINQGGNGSYTMTGGTLMANYLFVGDAGTATFHQSQPGIPTSVVTCRSGLVVGQSQTGSGSYTLTDGVLQIGDAVNPGSMFLGYAGQATFTQRGGYCGVSGNVFLAESATGRAAMNLHGGVFEAINPDAGTMYVGAAGIGVLNLFAGSTLRVNEMFVDSQTGTSQVWQEGGTTIINGHLGVGRDANAQGHGGAYLLTGGDLRVGTLFVGHRGHGTFTQIGGTLTIASGAIYLADEASGRAQMNFTGGTIVFPDPTTATIQVGYAGVGQFHQGEGLTLNLDTIFVNSQDGVSTFTQRGDVNLNSHLGVGRDAGSRGQYNLLSGTLTAQQIYLGYEGQGTMVQDGPSRVILAQELRLGDGGTGEYMFLSGNLQTHDTLVGIGGTDCRFDQRGGSHQITETLAIATNPGSTGVYHLSGVNLQVATVELNAGGVFNQTGGDLRADRFNQRGGEVQGQLQNRGVFVYDSGVFSGRLLNYGEVQFNADFTAGNGLGHYSATPLTLNNPARTLTCGGGGLEIGAGASFLLGDGSVRFVNTPANGLAVRSGGVFEQRGGLVDGSSNTFFVTEGSTTLVNGTLRPGGTMTVSPGGIFTQQGGVVDGLSNTILVTEGRFDLENGTVRPGQSMEIRNGGTFNQRGGLVDGASNTIAIFEGTCNVSGGEYRANRLEIHTGGSFLWTGGSFSYNTLFFDGGSFFGNLTNQGWIGGNGTFTGALVNQGTVTPGASPGTLQVVGSFSQGPTGRYVCEIAGPAAYDRIEVTGTPGTASLDGLLAPTLLGGFRPARGQLFPGIITASGGVSGTFARVEEENFWEVIYHATSVDLLARPFRDFTDPRLNLTSNQLQVGQMLNGLEATAQGDLATVLTALSDLPDGQVGRGLQQLTPGQNAAMANLSLAGAMMQGRSVIDRMNFLRQGGAAGTGGGFGGRLGLQGSRLQGVLLAYNGASLPGLFSGRPEAGLDKPWGLYANFLGTLGTQDTTSRQIGYDYGIFGLNTGIDYRLRPDLVLGVFTGYYYTSSNFKDDGGDARIHSVPFTVYGVYHPGNGYLTGSLGYTVNFYRLERSLAFGAVNRTATSSFTGSQLNLAWETGYDLRWARLVLTPAANLFYSVVWLPAHTESGAGALNLRVGAQTADSLQTGIGLRVSLPWMSGQTRILPQFSAFYQHEYANSARTLDARLSQAGGAFTFQTEAPSRDFAVLGAGLEVRWPNGLALQAAYNAEVGRQHSTAHYLNAGLRWEF